MYKYRHRCNARGITISYAMDCRKSLAEWWPGTCGGCWVKKTSAAVRLVVVDDDASEHLTFMSLFCYCGRLLIGHVERRLDRFADELV
ncbi:hypothetical protein DIPPA_17156 [Diplonema papillatum]|nr:hypothetical protein DIPPA_17156 [Diplonema papillatum]